MIESELSFSKNVNSKLHKRVVALEKQCWGNSQYSRRECLEITGFPDSISKLISWTWQWTLQTLKIITG